MYADDTQIYKSCRPSEIVDTINSIEQCISNAKIWMFHNKLQMSDDKTEAILFARKGLATEHLPKSIKIYDTRSEERRVGKECSGLCRSMCYPHTFDEKLDNVL